jgi:hypothetical protein
MLLPQLAFDPSNIRVCYVFKGLMARHPRESAMTTTNAKQTSSSSDRRGNGGDVPPPPSSNGVDASASGPGGRRSIFADVEALKVATAAKLGETRRVAGTELVLHKPKASWYFRTPVDQAMLFPGAVWEDPDNRDLLHFIGPNLWDLEDFEGAWKPVTFVPYVTAGPPPIHGVWPVSTIGGNTYNSTAWEAVIVSRTQWVRMWTVRQKGIYRHRISDTDFGEPQWSGLTIFEQLEIAFKDRETLFETDPLIARLRGQS